MIYRITPILALVAVASAQYGGGYDSGRGYNGGYDHNAPQQGYSGYNNNKFGPHVAILNHKQALGNDGTFNYAFNADNGIQQGESINPDGSRQGSYSYVDPSGKTVSLKYVAGKDGFRVLEGDHIPRSVPLPAQHAAAYQAAHAQAAEAAHRGPAPAYQGYQSSPAYGGSASYRRPYSVEDAEDDKGSYFEPSNQQQNYRSYNSANDESEPIHNGPHSFGNGYAFEFTG